MTGGVTGGVTKMVMGSDRWRDSGVTKMVMGVTEMDMGVKLA